MIIQYEKLLYTRRDIEDSAYFFWLEYQETEKTYWVSMVNATVEHIEKH